MFLAIDIGNSDIVFGWHENGSWSHQLRIPVGDYLSVQRRLSAYVEQSRLPWSQIDQIALSSVVPGITPSVSGQVTRSSGKAIFTLNQTVFEQLNLGIQNTAEIGSDLVANAVAGFAHFHRSCIVVDFGTALTFTVVNDKGHLRGVTIAPGLGTAMRALSSSTAQLPQVPLELPESAIGTSTPHALQAGIMLGYVGLVKELINRMRDELGEKVPVAATGGLSQKLTPLSDFLEIVDPWLTLEGIRLIASR